MAAAFNDEHWRRVAEVYQDAASKGLPATQAVAKTFECPYRTAARWTRQVVDKGLMPRVKRGGFPYRNPKALAVAEALGVSYEALVIAVRDHAAGTLVFGMTEENIARG